MKPDAIDDIKSRIDIHDLLAEYVDLKRAGQNYKGLCPFHSEKTPSFMVNPSKQIFHCFGCNKGGDIFTFIMNYENMTFNEAVSFLAGRAGVQIESTRLHDPNKGIKEAVFAIHEEATRFFMTNLKASNHVLSYLEERGLKSETIEKFSLGYAKGERNPLLLHLRAAGFSDGQLKSSGLAYFGEGEAHDFFRDRLIFPIIDLRGKVVAFGGRTLSSSKNIPKYLNSPENPIFRKGESCYALNIAKNHIVQKGYSIIVEGYLDVIMCHQFGFSNAVAPLGTALTPGHIKRLKKLSGKVLLTFDADPAGIAAAKRGLELAYAEGMISKIVLLSEGEDPDTFLRKYGAEQFRTFLAKALSPVRFFLSRAGKSKIDGVRQFLAILSSCHDPLLRDEALRELSDLASEKVLREELAAISRKPSGAFRQQVAPTSETVTVPTPKAMNKEEEILLNIALSLPRMALRIAENVSAEDLEHPFARNIFEKILSLHLEEECSVDNLLMDCNPEERTIISKLSITPGIDMDEVAQNVADCISKIRLKGINRKISAAKNEGDADSLRTLLRERTSLMQKPVELFPPKRTE
jgi:DNA primase